MSKVIKICQLGRVVSDMFLSIQTLFPCSGWNFMNVSVCAQRGALDDIFLILQPINTHVRCMLQLMLE